MFRGSRAVDQGLLTWDELRSSAWRPLFRDGYADADVPASHRLRCLAAARLLLPPGGAIAGRSAAALFEVTRLAGTDPVEVLVPSACQFEPVNGLRVHRATLSGPELVERAGMVTTSPVRTCWDLASWLDPVEAVVLIDAMLGRRLVTVPGLRDYALGWTGRRGWRKLLRAVDLADPAAESPQESRVRVRLVLAGLPRPVAQHVVTDGGRFLARVDLAWPELRIAIEYDGVWHSTAEQLHRDRRRLNRLLGGDWIVLHVTGQRLREDFDGFLAEVRAALRSRAPRAA
ncbi:endonuclease domain-containing protein [Plantactinospora sp. GCM10030261]|uniref:endonuclease domain-containing protein n=1 Tax=Plantactinospora sp. GCM10030261 TaxID=3273420 RepID=UPI003615812C